MSYPSDHDLTVMVDRAAQAIAEKEGHIWDEMPGAVKNLVREQALPFIFHGTKALEELGYRKPRVITTAEELDALDAGSAILCEGDRTGEGVNTQVLILATAQPPATGFHWRNHWITYFAAGMLDDFDKVTVLYEPQS